MKLESHKQLAEINRFGSGVWSPINAGIRRSMGIIAGSLMLLMVGAALFLLVPRRADVFGF